MIDVGTNEAAYASISQSRTATSGQVGWEKTRFAASNSSVVDQGTEGWADAYIRTQPLKGTHDTFTRTFSSFNFFPNFSGDRGMRSRSVAKYKNF